MEIKDYQKVLVALRELVKLRELKKKAADQSLPAANRREALNLYCSSKEQAWSQAAEALSGVDIERAQHESRDQDTLRSILAWCQPSVERWPGCDARIHSTREHIAKLASDAISLQPFHSARSTNTNPGILDFQASVNELMLVAYGEQKTTNITFHGRRLLEAVFELMFRVGMDQMEISALLNYASVTLRYEDNMTCLGDALIHMCSLATALKVDLSRSSQDTLQAKWFNVTRTRENNEAADKIDTAMVRHLNETLDTDIPTIEVPAAMTAAQAQMFHDANHTYSERCLWTPKDDNQQVQTEDRITTANVVEEAAVSTSLVDVSALLSDILRVIRWSEPTVEDLKSQSLVLIMEISRWYAKNGSREPSAAERACGPLSLRTLYMLLNSWAAVLPEQSAPLLKCCAMSLALREQIKGGELDVDSIMCQCAAECLPLGDKAICRKLLPNLDAIIARGIPTPPTEPVVVGTKNDAMISEYRGERLDVTTANMRYEQDRREYYRLVAQYWQAVALKQVNSTTYQLPTN